MVYCCVVVMPYDDAILHSLSFSCLSLFSFYPSHSLLSTTGEVFFSERLVAFLAASASIAPLFDAFGADVGGFNDGAHFLVARAALGAPGTKAVVATIFFPLQVFSPDILP
jgi:hypothetical protein